MGFLNKVSYTEKKDEVTQVRKYEILDMSTSRKVCEYLVMGDEIKRRAGCLMLQDSTGAFYCLKTRNSPMNPNTKFSVISEDSFEGAWSRIERLGILDDLDIAGENIVYRAGNIRLKSNGDSYEIVHVIKE